MDSGCGTFKYQTLLTPTIAAMPETEIDLRTHHTRLLEGMARCVAAQGYADTTIADIVREAGVSRRTFYEYFTDKPGCLIALHEAASQNALAVLRSAINPDRGWEQQVEQAIGAYLGALAQNPVLMHKARARAVVGGINELVLQAIAQDRVAQLADLVAPAGALLRAVVTAQSAVPGFEEK